MATIDLDTGLVGDVDAMASAVPGAVVAASWDTVAAVDSEAVAAVDSDHLQVRWVNNR